MFLSYDNDGVLRVHEQRPTRALAEELTAERGLNRIPIARGHRMIGWANDVGLLMPERFNRNPVASCVLASLGAAKQPYAGPIVITGFLYDEWGELLDLNEHQRSEIENLDQAVRAVLANQPIPDEVDRYLDLHPSWPDLTRTYADQVVNSDVPPVTIR